MEAEVKTVNEPEEETQRPAGTIIIEDRRERNVKLSPEILVAIKESFEGYLRSNPEFVREIFNEAFRSASDEIIPRQISRDIAKTEIHEFINKNPGCKTSDIILNLNLDPTLVMEILKQLKEEDVVQSNPVEQRSHSI